MNDARTFVQRVTEDRDHFPWWYTEFGTICACSRPVLIGDDCAVLVRARRWQGDS